MAQAAYRRSGRGSARRRGVGIGVVVADVRGAFVEHNLLTYAAAMAFQMIVALLPLAFLSRQPPRPWSGAFCSSRGARR